MKFTRKGSIQLIAGVIAGASAIIVACGGDDATGTSSDPDGGASSSGGSSGGSSGTASSSGGSSGSTTDGGGDGGTGDGGGGGDGGGKKANGVGPCASGAECQSGECFVGKKESYCSIKCDDPGEDDPKCEAQPNVFDGECNNQGYCKPK